MRYLWLVLFLFAASIWSVQIGRPVDLPNWHEFDYCSIARNFLSEGDNILYPRIDWRGDGPGFTEMEFPVIPWVIAQLYHIFGIHEIIGRILSYAFTLLSLAVFIRLALKVLPERAAFVAALFFTVDHAVTLIATAIQPEPLMLLFYLLAVYYYLDWYDTQSWLSYWLAIISFASAMLVKSPAAHLAIFFLLWAIYKDGLKAFRRPSLYFFAVLSFAPVLLWYAHAASLWHQFHNSMGVSNEDHWFGLDILKRPKVIINLISIDVLLVAGGGGALVAFLVAVKNRLQSAVNRLALYWCFAIGIYLVVIIRTAGAHWASYYHVIAVPPLALLFAAGLFQAKRANKLRIALWSSLAGLALVATLTVLSRRDVSHLPGFLQDLLSAHSSFIALLVLSVLSIAVTVLCLDLAAESVTLNRPSTSSQQLALPLIVIGCFTYFFLSGQMMLGLWKTFSNRTPEFVSAQALKDKLAPDSLIVASGGICVDPGGHRVASDAPNMFYWLGHKGFTTCQGQESVAELESFASRGAQYFLADKASFKDEPAFETELRRSFPLLADSDTTLLFGLHPK